jgi:hypothetical protein
LLLFGCSKRTEKNDVTPIDTGGEVSVEPTSSSPAELSLLYEDKVLLTQILGLCSEAVVVDDFQYLCNTEDGTELRDERNGSSTVLGQFSMLAAALDSSDAPILALDGSLYTLDVQELVPVQTAISTPISRMERHGESIWLWGLGRLFRWTGGSITEISLPEYSTIYDFTVAESRLYLSVPWLIEVDLIAAPVEVLWVSDVLVDSLRTDRDGHLWFVADGELFLKRLDEPIRTMVLPEPVVSVMGPTIWVQGVESSYRYHTARFSRHLFDAQGSVGVDNHGRLLQVHEGELRRHSIDRPMVVSGLSSSVMVRETVLLLPSDPDSVTELRVWMDSSPLDVMVDPWSVDVDPEEIGDGEHTLRFFMSSELGDQLDTIPVWVGELPEVLWSEIEALSETHCLACHGGATLTDLSTKEGWEQRIDLVIEQVSSNKMPLGGPYLSDDEITMIRGWKHGGFQ